MKKLGRPCDRCEKRFVPNGKRTKICDNCIRRNFKWRKKLKDEEKTIQTQE